MITMIKITIDLEHLKELHELHKDYPIAPDKLEIKIEILSDQQLKIADDSNISVGNTEKLVPNFFKQRKACVSLKKLQLYLRL